MKKGCHNFQQKGVCYYGSKCRFSHLQDSEVVKETPCRFFLMTRGCSFGLHCRFSHQVEEGDRSQNGMSVPRRIDDDSPGSLAVSLSSLALVSRSTPEPSAAERNQANRGLIFEKNYGVVGWLALPKELHMSPSITVEEIRHMLQHELHVETKTRDLPSLHKSPRLPMVLKTFDEPVKPALKPNLLMIVLKVMMEHLRVNQLSLAPILVTEANLLENLGTHDIIVPRKVLKSIITAAGGSEPWECFGCRPSEKSPLFLDRTELYDTNAGSVGMLFERAMIASPGRYERVYIVSRITLDGISCVLSGEIDAFDDEGK
jgi:hypothetical protein